MDQEPVVAARKFIAKHWFLTAFLGLVGLVAIIAIAVGVYYYNQYASLNAILKNPNVAVEKQTNQLVGQVGKLMMLPTDETPTIATVTDASKLKDQTFFKEAKDGDKVLIYVKAKKAILYDPVKNIIVDVAPVNINQGQQAAQSVPTVTPYPTLVPITLTITPNPTP